MYKTVVKAFMYMGHWRALSVLRGPFDFSSCVGQLNIGSFVGQLDIDSLVGQLDIGSFVG
jgi:hypothetical protein